MSASLYDRAVRHLPSWKTWLRSVLSYVCGPRVLEVSFGTGYLLAECAPRFDTHGVDYNRRMAAVASANLRRAGLDGAITVWDVTQLPYRDHSFDSVITRGLSPAILAVTKRCRR